MKQFPPRALVSPSVDKLGAVVVFGSSGSCILQFLKYISFDLNKPKKFIKNSKVLLIRCALGISGFLF